MKSRKEKEEGRTKCEGNKEAMKHKNRMRNKYEASNVEKRKVQLTEEERRRRIGITKFPLFFDAMKVN